MKENNVKKFMKKLLTIILIFAIISISFTSCAIFKKSTSKNTLITQKNLTLSVLTIEGTTTVNTSTGEWDGVNILRTTPTRFTFVNNYITSQNNAGYMLQAGTDNLTNDGSFGNLDGEVITGNYLNFTGSVLGENSGLVHGLMTCNMINCDVRYNKIKDVAGSFVIKGHGNTYTSGGYAYNIVKVGLVGANILGMNGVYVYNNTFYSNHPFYSSDNLGVWRGIINIYQNDQNGSPIWGSTGTKIKNNIFYTVHQIPCISIHNSNCLSGFESDYNIFYCEAGEPYFQYLEDNIPFSEWQALGYDTHSIVINPNFNNFNDFVPAARLNYGTNLGTIWQIGLSITATWVVNSPPATVNQNGTWQVGARIYDVSVPLINVSNVVQFIVNKNSNKE
jgi:hypothetical protein